MDDIGGLENLKLWLKRKAEIFKKHQGGSRLRRRHSQGREFDVPLLRLYMDRLMGKYVGESESNMRRAIKLTEASSRLFGIPRLKLFTIKTIDRRRLLKAALFFC